MLSNYRFQIQGIVQGVGFRPFIYRLAREYQLTGTVANTNVGVVIEVHGQSSLIDQFYEKILSQAPLAASIEQIKKEKMPTKKFQAFSILASTQGMNESTGIISDLATCEFCLEALFNEQDRRFRYPFINCSHCGPRYSILRQLPYDRINTSMALFAMCEACNTEYHDPQSRFFHAEPICCPCCGPKMWISDHDNNDLALFNEKAIDFAAGQLKKGKIIAVKGIGGFHLYANAFNESLIQKLRSFKKRTYKPLALMMKNLRQVNHYCVLNDREQKLLLNQARPITLLRLQSSSFPMLKSICPKQYKLGVMLPYSPLHHLLFDQIDFPLAATSGNLEGHPICVDNLEAWHKLKNIADYFLYHNRKIVTHVDDSVAQCVQDKTVLIRAGRGYAPMQFNAAQPIEALALGGHIKSSIAVKKGSRIYISQHLGDLENVESFNAYNQLIQQYMRLLQIKPKLLAGDWHPNYLSTQVLLSETWHSYFKRQYQHHQSHVAACMYEHHLTEDVIAVAFDGAGFSMDGTVWGGEFFIGNVNSLVRVASLRPFLLPGGYLAVKECRRVMFAILSEIPLKTIKNKKFVSKMVDSVFSEKEKQICSQAMIRGLNCPQTSSMGRLFDALASLLDICHVNEYEGQAASWLEAYAIESHTEEEYPYKIDRTADCDSIDWRPMFNAMITELALDTTILNKQRIAKKFHNTIAGMIFNQVRSYTFSKVILAGGCFQNALLLNLVNTCLCRAGYQVFFSERVPINDGGLSLGQMALLLNEKEIECA